jgi:hypothetical protein
MRTDASEAPVLGTVADMPRLDMAMAVRHVIIAMPSSTGDTIRKVLQLARSTGLETRTVPSLHERIVRGTSVSALRELRIEADCRHDRRTRLSRGCYPWSKWSPGALRSLLADNAMRRRVERESSPCRGTFLRQPGGTADDGGS